MIIRQAYDDTVIREIFVSKNFRPLNFRIFVPATPYRSNMHTFYTAMKNFVHLIFVLNCAYENFLTTKISRTTVVYRSWAYQITTIIIVT